MSAQEIAIPSQDAAFRIDQAKKHLGSTDVATGGTANDLNHEP